MADFGPKLYRDRINWPDAVSFPADIGQLIDGDVCRVGSVRYEWQSGGTDHGGTQKFWQQLINEDGAKGFGTIWLSFTGVSAPETTTSSTVYTVMARFTFPGSDEVGIPKGISSIVWKDAGGGGTTVDIRIFDLDNALVIAELTGITDGVPTVHDLGVLANIPTGEAIFEVQMKRTGGGATAATSGLKMEF